jgi:hypothetical protein
MTWEKRRNLGLAKEHIDVVRVSWFSTWGREILAIRGQIDTAVFHGAYTEAAALARILDESPDSAAAESGQDREENRCLALPRDSDCQPCWHC